MKVVYLSLWSSTRSTQHGWRSFATREEAERDQRRKLPGWADGIEEHPLAPGFEPGEEWECG